MKSSCIAAAVLTILLSIVGCGQRMGLTTEITVRQTPSDVLRAHFEAVKNKDAAAVKRTLSQRCFELYEQKAAEEKVPLDAVLTRGHPGIKLPPNLSETMDGDTAVVELGYPKAYEWAGQLYFVREGGEWKFACDKTNEAIDRRMNPPAGTSNLAGGATPTATLLALCDAWNKFDVAAMKRSLSKDGIILLTRIAREGKVSVDQMIEELRRDNIPQMMVPRVRNERINGNRATVEVTMEGAREWGDFYLIKEDGLWKVDLVEILEHLPVRLF